MGWTSSWISCRPKDPRQVGTRPWRAHQARRFGWIAPHLPSRSGRITSSFGQSRGRSIEASRWTSVGTSRHRTGHVSRPTTRAQCYGGTSPATSHRRMRRSVWTSSVFGSAMLLGATGCRLGWVSVGAPRGRAARGTALPRGNERVVSAQALVAMLRQLPLRLTGHGRTTVTAATAPRHRCRVGHECTGRQGRRSRGRLRDRSVSLTSWRSVLHHLCSQPAVRVRSYAHRLTHRWRRLSRSQCRPARSCSTRPGTNGSRVRRFPRRLARSRR